MRPPDSYPLPKQFIMPSGPEPAVAMPDPNRLLIEMADLDWKSHALAGVLDGPDGEEMRWCRPSVRFRLTPKDVQGLSFYMRFILVDDLLRQSGAAALAVSINGRELDRAKLTNGGEQEYRHPVPNDWLAAGQPVTIAVDITPPLATPGGELGVLLRSIGFKK